MVKLIQGTPDEIVGIKGTWEGLKIGLVKLCNEVRPPQKGDSAVAY